MAAAQKTQGNKHQLNGNSKPAEQEYGYVGAGNRTTSSLSAIYGYQPFNRLVSTASATYS